MMLYLILKLIMVLTAVPTKAQLQYKTRRRVLSFKFDENQLTVNQHNGWKAVGSHFSQQSDLNLDEDMKMVLDKPGLEIVPTRSNKKSVNNPEIVQKSNLGENINGHGNYKNVDIMNIKVTESFRVLDIPIRYNKIRNVSKQDNYSDNGNEADMDSTNNGCNTSKEENFPHSNKTTDSVFLKGYSRGKSDSDYRRKIVSVYRNEAIIRKETDSSSRRPINFDSKVDDLFKVDTVDSHVSDVNVNDKLASKDFRESTKDNTVVNEGILRETDGELNEQNRLDNVFLHDARLRRSIFVKDSQEEKNKHLNDIFKMSEMSIELCPYADFCYSNATNFYFYDNAVSCCKPCYCDANCGERLDCCFETFDTYKEVKKKQMHCMTPQITSSANGSKLLLRDYYMIHQCLTDTQNDCKNKTVASWGSFLPVYSRTADKIYFNMHCAECNYVYDSVSWNVSLLCKFVLEPKVMNDFLLQALDDGACELTFIPPDDEGIDKFSCHKNAVNTCNFTGKWAKDDPVIRKACEMVYAPVGGDSFENYIMYANVFCKLCNEDTHDPLRLCAKYKHPLKEMQTSFAVLLDLEVVNAARRRSDAKQIDNLKDQSVCGQFQLTDPNKDECREILCPNGYLRTPNGCQIYTHTWYVKGYRVFVDLKAESQPLLPLSAILGLSFTDIMNILNMNGLPTDVFVLLAEISTDFMEQVEYVRGFRMEVGSSEFPTDAIRVLETIKNALEQNWEIVFNVNSYIYKASLSRTVEPEFYGEPGDGRFTFISTYSSFTPSFTINKLYFCDQIELRPDEWTIQNYDRELKLTGAENDTILYFLEFNTQKNKNGELTVQICVDDFKLHYRQFYINNCVCLRSDEKMLLALSLINYFCMLLHNAFPFEKINF